MISLYQEQESRVINLINTEREIEFDGGNRLRIYVVDLETTGLGGYVRGDLVLEIGIALLDTISGRVKVVYDTPISYPPDKMKPHRNAWIFRNSSLTIEDVMNGKPIEIVKEEIRDLLSNKEIAIYNVAYDFEKFLRWPPYNLAEVVAGILPCIMVSATKVCRIPSRFFGFKWPTLEEARKKLLPGVRIPSHFKPHRAAADAYLSALVLQELIRLGQYNIQERYIPRQINDEVKKPMNNLSKLKVSFEDFLNEKKAN